jgi:hypothetical protein
VTRALLSWRTARKQYSCEFCARRIKPGERYVSAALPPRTDIGNDGWWHSASCGENGFACEAYWSVDDPYERPLETP